jgi:hypothetical protein
MASVGRKSQQDKFHPSNDTADDTNLSKEVQDMRSILLWLLGVPIPIIILIALFSH